MKTAYMIVTDACKKYGLSLFKTSSIFFGALCYKNGKIILVLEDIAKRTSMGNAPAILLIIVSSGSVIYTLSFTRLPAFWKRYYVELDSNQTVPVVQELTQKQKKLKMLAWVIWLFNSPFNFMNTYAGAQAILGLLGAGSNNPITYILSSYAALADQVNYNIYTYARIYSNCLKIETMCQCNFHCATFSLRNFALKRILDLGTLSISALNFFLTQDFMSNFPLTRELPEGIISFFSMTSAISMFFSQVFSKNMEMHQLIDNANIDFNTSFDKLKTSPLIYSHSILSLIYTLCMGASYYIGCLNLSEEVNTNDSFEEIAWYSIITYILLSASGSMLEFAFNVWPMFDTSRIEEDSTTLPVPADNIKADSEITTSQYETIPEKTSEFSIIEERNNTNNLITTENNLGINGNAPIPTSKHSNTNLKEIMVAPQENSKTYLISFGRHMNVNSPLKEKKLESENLIGNRKGSNQVSL